MTIYYIIVLLCILVIMITIVAFYRKSKNKRMMKEMPLEKIIEIESRHRLSEYKTDTFFKELFKKYPLGMCMWLEDHNIIRIEDVAQRHKKSVSSYAQVSVHFRNTLFMHYWETVCCLSEEGKKVVLKDVEGIKTNNVNGQARFKEIYNKYGKGICLTPDFTDAGEDMHNLSIAIEKLYCILYTDNIRQEHRKNSILEHVKELLRRYPLVTMKWLLDNKIIKILDGLNSEDDIFSLYKFSGSEIEAMYPVTCVSKSELEKAEKKIKDNYDILKGRFPLGITSNENNVTKLKYVMNPYLLIKKQYHRELEKVYNDDEKWVRKQEEFNKVSLDYATTCIPKFRRATYEIKFNEKEYIEFEPLINNKSYSVDKVKKHIINDWDPQSETKDKESTKKRVTGKLVIGTYHISQISFQQGVKSPKKIIVNEEAHEGIAPKPKVNRISLIEFYLEDYSTTDIDSIFYSNTNAERIPKLKEYKTNYSDTIYENLVEFIFELKKKYSDLYVLIVLEKKGWDRSILKKHFEHFVKRLDERDLYSEYLKDFTYNKNWKDLLSETNRRHYVIVDLTTENKGLVNNFKEVIKVFNSEKAPNVLYISLLKCYDEKEVNEQIEKSKEEEEESRKEIEQRTKAIESFAENSKEWPVLLSQVPFYYLADYYPVTTTVGALSSIELHNRYTILDFKNDSDKTDKHGHDYAVKKVISHYKDILSDTFGYDNLKYLTLCCIPTSTKKDNENRYKDFSEKFCEATGMINSFNFIDVIKDGRSKHGGNYVKNEISINEKFFKDKYVLLFDDIITTGNSMIRFKKRLEEMGAHVVACISIGRTKHHFFSEGPLPYKQAGQWL